MKYFVYLLASKRNGTLYIGVTNNLERRILEHKNDLIPGFSEKYQIHMLVYYEETNDIQSALIKEKQLKKWNRKWKLALIEKSNPFWNDLAKELDSRLRGNDNKGGAIAKNARLELEHKTGRKVVSGENFKIPPSQTKELR